jgi:type III secretion system YscD/HrpQ family protein
MAGFLIGEEGPLAGLIIRFEGKEEWALGRDPDEVDLLLEDPMVSRKHVICRLTTEGFVLENLSSVNPATQNGKVVVDPVLLREGDIIRIGSTFFRFSEEEPSPIEPKEPRPPLEGAEELSEVNFDLSSLTRWLLKVVSGPNSGAEFSMHKGSTYILGKDPTLCDVIFQDLSVSRQHARLTVTDQEEVFIEDLGSRNGVLINGELITDRRPLSSQDLIALGTTSFLIIDREEARETIISPPVILPQKRELAQETSQISEGEGAQKDWKELIIPKKHLLWAGVALLFVACLVVSMISLLKTETVELSTRDEVEQIKKVISKYPDMQFSFSEATGKLLLIGHVLTNVDKMELLYFIQGLPFVTSVDDAIVVDEFVWQNMNALLAINPAWQGVTFYSSTPGRFVMRGYLKTLEQAESLSDYVNMNFPYLDRLDNQVIIESNLLTEINSVLIEKGFSGVTFELSNGELVLSGRVDAKMLSPFGELVDHFKALQGIRLVKNFVIYTTADTSRIDLSDRYRITGYSKRDDMSYYIVINGRVLSPGDTLDGMMITEVESTAVFLEKDGLKFRINYNQQ